MLGNIALFFDKKKVSEEQTPASFPPLVDQHDWYYLDEEHKQHGPVAYSQIKALDEETYIWHEGMQAWTLKKDIGR